MNDTGEKVRSWLILSNGFCVTWKRIQLWNQKHFLRSHTPRAHFSFQSIASHSLTLAAKGKQMKALESFLPDFHRDPLRTLRCLELIPPSVLRFGISAGVFALQNDFQICQIWNEWINNAETMWTWHFLPFHSRCVSPFWILIEEIELFLLRLLKLKRQIEKAFLIPIAFGFIKFVTRQKGGEWEWAREEPSQVSSRCAFVVRKKKKWESLSIKCRESPFAFCRPHKFLAFLFIVVQRRFA